MVNEMLSTSSEILRPQSLTQRAHPTRNSRSSGNTPSTALLMLHVAKQRLLERRLRDARIYIQDHQPSPC